MKEVLSDDEQALAQAMIERTDAGTYTIQEIYSPEYYDCIVDKNRQGVRFKESVAKRKLHNISFHDTRSDHVARYVIKGG
jgi:hypothetical protein